MVKALGLVSWPRDPELVLLGLETHLHPLSLPASLASESQVAL